jgi:hypothetical protein
VCASATGLALVDPGGAGARQPGREAHKTAKGGPSARLRVELVLAATGGAAFEVVGGLLGPFVRDAGGSEAALAAFYAGPALVGPIVGGLSPARSPTGAASASRCGSRPSALVVVVLALAAAAGRPADLALFALLGCLYLGYGAFVASSDALSWTAPTPSSARRSSART